MGGVVATSKSKYQMSWQIHLLPLVLAGKLAVPSSAECKYSAILSKDSTAYLVPSSSAHVGAGFGGFNGHVPSLLGWRPVTSRLEAVAIEFGEPQQVFWTWPVGASRPFLSPTRAFDGSIEEGWHGSTTGVVGCTRRRRMREDISYLVLSTTGFPCTHSFHP